MASVTLDFVEGDVMIVMRHDKFTVEHFSGNFRMNRYKGNNFIDIEYGTGKECNYSEEMIPAENCFHDLKELVERTNLRDVMDATGECISVEREIPVDLPIQ